MEFCNKQTCEFCKGIKKARSLSLQESYDRIQKMIEEKPTYMFKRKLEELDTDYEYQEMRDNKLSWGES